jgi:hypothetical protein
MADIDVVLVASHHDASDAIRTYLVEELDGDAHVAEKRGLDGSVAEWIIVGGVAARSVKPLLDFVLRFVELRRVRRITVGDVTVENPRPQDVDRLIDRLPKRRDGGDDERPSA